MSTQQILHPEAYLDKRTPTMTDAPTLDAALGKDRARQYKALAEGCWGVRHLRAGCASTLKAREAARRRRGSPFCGGSYRLYEGKARPAPDSDVRGGSGFARGK